MYIFVLKRAEIGWSPFLIWEIQEEIFIIHYKGNLNWDIGKTFYKALAMMTCWKMISKELSPPIKDLKTN